MSIDAVPGLVFKGKIVSILPAMSEGEIQASGALISSQQISTQGSAVAIIQIDEDLTQYELPRGVQGKIAIYSDQFSHVSIIRKVLLRLLGWLNL